MFGEFLDASSQRFARVGSLRSWGVPGWGMPQRFTITVSEMIWAPLPLKSSHRLLVGAFLSMGGDPINVTPHGKVQLRDLSLSRLPSPSVVIDTRQHLKDSHVSTSHKETSK